jgi:hypothetical protein
MKETSMPDSITPSQDLRDKWLNEAPNTSVYDYLIDRAAQWGADQELEACCEWMSNRSSLTEQLRSARRPKPPSLKEQALDVLEGLRISAKAMGVGFDSETIRRALEALPDD